MRFVKINLDLLTVGNVSAYKAYFPVPISKGTPFTTFCPCAHRARAKLPCDFAAFQNSSRFYLRGIAFLTRAIYNADGITIGTQHKIPSLLPLALTVSLRGVVLKPRG